ncbi:MAG: isoprenylcysteine carboxylmethyltransferase family protein [Pseudomonadota bacterium]
MPERSDTARITLALSYGALCHGLFALGAGAMVLGLFTGLMFSFGSVPWPWAVVTNLVLLAQFPLAHSFLLGKRGRALLARMGPGGEGKRLATTTYAIIASIQLFILFTLWTPSEVVVFRAEGAAFYLMSALFAGSWLLLAKATFDAGPQLQSGALGWIALLRNRAPKFPDMPETGLFRIIRQPIYVSFALALWTPPIWTLDQLVIAVTYTAYCILAPLRKERRFLAIYGDRFKAYRKRVPYWLPLPLNKRT